MITELTPEQEKKFDEYVKLWTEKGLTTARRTEKEAKKVFKDFQLLVLKKPTAAPVVLVDSPKEAWDIVDKTLNPNGKERLKFVYPYFDAQFWASWFAFYEFCRIELKVDYKNNKEYDAFMACQGFGMVFPLDEVCVVCQPLSKVETIAAGLHCENGAALSYKGENELYALNGVVMKKEYVLTPAEQLSPTEIMKETNVEVRRELIRKVGIERMLEALPHKLLDTRDNYELYSLELSEEVKDARYLKMVNPSISVFHMEGVAPEISTVSDALKWRNDNMFEDAEVLT